VLGGVMVKLGGVMVKLGGVMVKLDYDVHQRLVSALLLSGLIL